MWAKSKFWHWLKVDSNFDKEFDLIYGKRKVKISSFLGVDQATTGGGLKFGFQISNQYLINDI